MGKIKKTRKLLPGPVDDEFGKHELLDRSSLIAGIFDVYILGHPLMKEQDPKIKIAVKAISEQLGMLFQLFGSEM